MPLTILNLWFLPKNFDRAFPTKCINDKEIRLSYKGGFTYAKKDIREKDIGSGIVLDVNSLYPSVMYDRPMPYGEPQFFKGHYIPDSSYPLFVIALKCQFKLKENHLPTIQLKNSRFFAENDTLCTVYRGRIGVVYRYKRRHSWPKYDWFDK